MSAKGTVARILNSAMRAANVQVVRASTLDALRMDVDQEHASSRTSLPPGAADYLRPDNPRLKELEDKYTGLHMPATDHSRWKAGFAETAISLRFFRADNGFMWQLRDGHTRIQYLLTAYYLMSKDKLCLFDVLKEDDLFGIHILHPRDGWVISRDLLDSVAEITFLEDTLGISSLHNAGILDIGAGYGRLAHRLAAALPNVGRIICTDAIAQSTFLSEYYLNFRGADDKAAVVPLFDIEDALSSASVEIATNIHSFSECTLAAIGWWLDLIARHRVRYLMIAPNASRCSEARLLSRETNGQRLDFFPALRERGYSLVTRRAKYEDLAVQENGVFPTHYYLFELSP